MLLPRGCCYGVLLLLSVVWSSGCGCVAAVEWLWLVDAAAGASHLAPGVWRGVSWMRVSAECCRLWLVVVGRCYDNCCYCYDDAATATTTLLLL